MEDTLGVHHPYFQAQLCRPVLILVLMEDTLGERTTEFSMEKVVSLNPCSNGRYFRRSIRKSTRVRLLVLILVLMEDTLGVRVNLLSFAMRSLNPCSNGRYSRSR